MKIHTWLFILLLLGWFAYESHAQPEQAIRRAAQGKVGVGQNELVSFNADVPYSKAIQSLGELSKKLESKLLIDRSPMQGKDKPIGINIESMYWKDALELILRSNELWYNDYPEYKEIVSFADVGKQLGEPVEKEKPEKEAITKAAVAPLTPAAPVVVDSSEYYAKTREIAISCVIFEINLTKMAESGVSFALFRGRDLNLEVGLSGSEKVLKKVFTASVLPTNKRIAVDIYAAISMFESEQLGDVIARPQITVRSNTFAKFQIGQDFSFLEKDFSGNTVQKFYPTGTILTVRPRIFKVGDLEFIDLLYNVERSNVEASTVTTLINKTSATGSLSLLNGEEGYIGGMYSNEVTTVREGVPLLKDLPWWFLGLRYLFGYDSKKVSKRELIVLMKADLLPLVEERAVQKAVAKDVVKDKLQEIEKDYENRTGKKLE
jgi:type IV pilus assembly protein PilQ